MYCIVLLLGLWINVPRCKAQSSLESDTLVDNSLKKMVDSISHDTNIYSTLHKAAAKNRWSRQLYSFLFNDPVIFHNATTNNSSFIDEEYLPYANKVIREIKIVVLGPFGNKLIEQDSSGVFLEQAGNHLHVNTKHYVVRNNLLFKEDDKVVPLDIAASETRLRAASYINDARIILDTISDTPDVIVTVLVRDVWSISLEVSSLAQDKFDIRTKDLNFYGTGNDLGINLLYNKEYPQKWGYGTQYIYKNFYGTFINLRGAYMDDIVGRKITFNVDRRLTRNLNYFGEFYHERYQRNFKNKLWDSTEVSNQINTSTTLGYAFGNDDAHLGRFVTAFTYRYTRPSYKQLDFPLSSNLKYNALLTEIFMGKVSLFKQRFYREYMIYSFGITETVPTGYSISTQLGYTRRKDYHSGVYTSFSVAQGKRYNFGFLFLRTQLALQYHNKKLDEGFLRLNFSYFSPILPVGGVNIRQFIDLNYSSFIHPDPNLNRKLFFSQYTSIDTQNIPDDPYGTQRLVLNSETDYYTKWRFLGFRFILFNFIDLSLLTSRGSLLQMNNLYWGTGMGVRIRNEMLVFKTLELKLGWYPRLGQSGLSNFIFVGTSDPSVAKDFTPSYPQPISIE